MSDFYELLQLVTLESGLIITAITLFTFMFGFITGLGWGPNRDVKQAKVVGYAITLLWIFLHIAAIVKGTEVSLLVDVIMGVFATGIYGDDFLELFTNRFKTQ